MKNVEIKGAARAAWLAGVLTAVALGSAASAAGCGGNGGTGASSSGTTASASGGPGGPGGAGGAGGADEGDGGAGGGGGQDGGASGTTCLDPSLYKELFAIEDAGFCAVAIYDADLKLDPYGTVPTWGSHGGPLTASLDDTGSVSLVRWGLPGGATGALTPQATSVPAMIPSGSFFGAQAVDLPFFGWTAVSYQGAFPNTQGEVILFKGSAVEARYDVNGLFAITGIGVPAAGRLVYSGLSALEDATTSTNSLYAADSCGVAGDDARLIPEGNTECGEPAAIAAWGDASGPVAADADGNVFAIMTSFSGDQEARAFAASAIARSAPPTSGDPLFTLPGYGSSLAALAPGPFGVGLLAFQPNDAMSAAALDVIAQRYTVASGKVSAEGGASVLLKLATPGTSLALMAGVLQRLWIGVPREGGGTTFVVIARVAQ